MRRFLLTPHRPSGYLHNLIELSWESLCDACNVIPLLVAKKVGGRAIVLLLMCNSLMFGCLGITKPNVKIVNVRGANAFFWRCWKLKSVHFLHMH